MKNANRNLVGSSMQKSRRRKMPSCPGAWSNFGGGFRRKLLPRFPYADIGHTFMLETVGDTMRATIDGKPVAFLQSPGIAHTTKSKVEFGCMGKDGFFDDLKIWNAAPAK